MINLKYFENLDEVIAFVTALNSFLLFIKILEILKPDYFILIRFTMRHEVFDGYIALSPFILVLTSILLLYMLYCRRFIEIGISLIPSVIFYIFFKVEIIVAVTLILIPTLLYSRKLYREYLRGLLITLILFQAFSFIHYIFLYFGVTTPFEVITYYEYRLQVISRIISPQLGHLLMASWVLLILPFVSPRFKSMFTGFSKEPLKLELFSDWYVDYRAVLSIAVLIAVFASIYPWGGHINPQHIPFSTDAHRYVERAEVMDLDKALSSDRATLNILLLFLNNVLKFPVESTVYYLPTLLNPLVVIANYIMVKKVTLDDDFSALTSLFYAVGLKIPITMSAFIIANSMAMIFLFISLGYLFDSLNKGRSVCIVSIISGILLIFTHQWTYIQYAGSLGFLVFILLMLKERNPRKFMPVIIFLVVTGSVYLLKGIVIAESDIVGGIDALRTVSYGLEYFWHYSHATYILLWGGLLGNSFYLILSIIGFTKLDKNEYFSLYLICLIAASSIIYTRGLVTYFSEGSFNHIPSRIVYNIPFHLFSSIGLVALLKNEKIDRKTVTLAIFFVIIYMSTNLFRSLYHITSA